MKNLAIILQVLITLFFFQSCEEYEMVQYGEGNEIILWLLIIYVKIRNRMVGEENI